MTLGLSTRSDSGTGEFLPILKYNSESGRLFQVDREMGPMGFESKDHMLAPPVLFVVDFGSIEVGFALFVAKQPPSWAMAPLGTLPKPVAPTPEYREGFRLRVWNPRMGVRELASTAKTLVGAIDELHDLFELAPEAASGLLPVVKYSDTLPITLNTPRGKKTTYRPVFSIERWVERGAEFGERTVPPPARKMGAGGLTAADGRAAAAAQMPASQAQYAGNGDWQPTNERHVAPPGIAATAQPHPLMPTGPVDPKPVAVDEWGSAPAVAAASADPWSPKGDLDDEIPF